MNNNMNNTHNKEKNELLDKIQKLAFAKIESQLFLNTHPECRGALEYFKEVVKNLNAARAEYAERYGAITPDEVDGAEWSWAMGDWPWHTGKEN